MSDSPRSRFRLPHWGWFLLASAVLVVGFVCLSIWLPWHREQQVIEKIEEWGGQVATKEEYPEWLQRIAGEDRLKDSRLSLRADTVRLSGREITNAEIAQLTGLTRLRGLDLRRTAVTDSGLVHLRGLTSLKYLILDRTDVTDDGLVHLNRLPKLRTLSLERTAVTDKGLVHLNRLTSLRRLHLGRTVVTCEGVETLQKALPDCEIVH